MLEPQPCLICTHDAYITVSMAITSDAYRPAFIYLEQTNPFQAGFNPCFTGMETNTQRIEKNMSEYTQVR